MATRQYPTEKSVFQKRSDRCRLKLLTPIKKFQLNQELCFEELSTRFANEDSRGSRSSARRQQIIYQHNLFAWTNCIDVHFHFGFAILERVTCDLRLERELATLSDRDETYTELVGDSRSEDEPARIDPNNLIDFSLAATIQKQIDGRTEQRRIAQDRGNIFEHDTFFWKIRHIAYGGAESFSCIQSHRRER